MTSHASRLKEALAGGQAKDKGPVVADGVLSVTPDPLEASWGPSLLDTVSADSTFLEDEGGKQPNQLFGKFTWKIENFSDISNNGTKRELRSNQFSVGEYKWYILVYPQGCDVCNHLSLFLCVADYDKLLPGWSHFAQFTVAVVNKDPKKSKYSDTLHRFCKKEHDWGWKKFMELSKVLDGFTVADTLVIKAQVQVILDRPNRPFRCLDGQYRRELVRVYLTNVESICRRFCEEKRQRLSWLRDDPGCFRKWWLGLTPERQKQLSREKGEAILKGIVKQFFNEREVTSTVVMDALFAGCRQLEKLGRDKKCLPEGFSQPTVVVNGRTSTFSFAMDALDIAAQLNQEFIPALKEDKALALCNESFALRGVVDELGDLRRDALERDEKRLAELGRKTVEMFALSHIFTQQLERAYRDYECEQRMRDLIAEEEAEGRLKDEQAAARAAADKEKKAKKRERQRVKKEAERAKREADLATAASAHDQQQKPAQAVLHKPEQQTPSHHQQQVGQLRGLQQGQQLPNGSLPLNSTSSSNNRQQQQQQQQQRAFVISSSGSRPTSRGQPAAAVPPSRPGSATAGPHSSSRFHSSSNSPLVGLSVASSEALSSSGTDSDSSSSSRGFTPVRRHHSQQQLQQQHMSRQGSAHSHGAGGWGVAHGTPGQQQQQQQQGHGSSSLGPAPLQQQPSSSSSSSIPTGYAAAVAGMQPPPPSEVTAAAVAMAGQQRRLRDVEEQVSVLKRQVKGLEALVTQKDVLIAQKDAVIIQQQHEAADLRSRLAQQEQQQQQHTLDSRRQPAAAVSVSSAAAAAGGSREVVASRPYVISHSRGSSSSRGTSADLSDAAAALGVSTSTSAPWAAVAATVAVHDRSDQQPGTRDSTPLGAAAGSAGQQGGDSRGVPAPPLSAARPVSYAETVSGAVHHHHHHNSLQQGSRPPSAMSSRTASGVIPPAATAGSVSSRLNSSDRAFSSSSSVGRPSSSVQEPTAAALSTRSSSRGSPTSSPTAAADEPTAPAGAAADAFSEDDVPVSPSSIGRSGCAAAAAAAAPGPPGSSSSLNSSSVDGNGALAPGSCSSSDTGTAHPDQHAAAAAASDKLRGSRAASAGSGGESSGAANGMPNLALKAASAYISNGIAGVLHSSTPLSIDAPATPCFRDPGVATNSGGKAAAPGGSVLGGSNKGILGSSSKSKAGSLASNGRDPFTAFGSQMPEGGSREMSFGPLPMANKGGVDAGQRTSQTSILEDNGLDGFVHMNMIDDLLTE